jgi:predicted transposase YbfD/YdcC
VLGITSLSSREAAAEHLAGYVRGHWAIENKIHWVRSPGAAGLLHGVARSG